MRIQYRNKRTIYIACRDIKKGADDYGNYTYTAPFEFNENLQAVDSASEITEFGDRIKNMYKSTVPKLSWFNKVHALDVVYMDGITPDGEKINGSKANYFIESIRDISPNVMTIYFERKP